MKASSNSSKPEAAESEKESRVVYYDVEFVENPSPPDMPYSEAHCINLLGTITGAYATDAEGTQTHGFIATPKLH